MKKTLATLLCVSQLTIPAIAQNTSKDILNKINAIESPHLSDSSLGEIKTTDKPKAVKIPSTVPNFFSTNSTPILSEKSIIRPVYSKNGMVATGSDIATNIAVEVLDRGGNAIDAAIATAFTMAVTMPRAGNIGGGGFMMVHDIKTKETRAIDYREMAPKLATADMYLDKDGNVDKKLTRHHHLSAGVPGTVKGMELAYRLYATMDWADLLQPSIHLAEQGFLVDRSLSNSLKQKRQHLSKSIPAIDVFYKPSGFYEPGEVLKQTDLAKTLKIISYKGADAFYKGEISDQIVASMKQHGGLITKEDLEGYKARIRKPVSGFYDGYKVMSMPPPSSGGVHLIQMLKILDGFDLKSWGFGSAQSIHVMAEAMRLAYADRSKYLGDPDFVKVPTRQIMSDLYASRLRKGISTASATPSELIEAGRFMPKESPQTTHFTIVDKWGNVVTNTYTLNFSYGSGHMVEGTGMLLNNEMDDFAAKVGAQNAYGLIGGDANKIEPEKRPLSSMTPTMIFDKDGNFFMSLGSPGGSRIITTVMQVILNVIDHGMNLAEAVMAPRMHHQWYPDEIRIEKGFSPDTIALLKHRGHKVIQKQPMGAVMAVMKTEHGYAGFADSRRGSALVKGAAEKRLGEAQEFDPLLLELIEELKSENKLPIAPESVIVSNSLNITPPVKAVLTPTISAKASDVVSTRLGDIKTLENSTPFNAMITPVRPNSSKKK